MADPKYADLPGIAYDQPDVYETSDLPEADQKLDEEEEEENEAIERLHIDATESFNKFKGKYLDTKGIDFSDRITRRPRTGYDARSGTWELVAEGEKETPLQKYQRLQCEMKELIEEVSQLKENQKEGLPTLLTSGNQLDQALKQLSDLRLEESLGEELLGSLNDPQGSQIKKLLIKLDEFKQKSSKAAETGSSDGNDLTYKLKYRPDQTRLAQTARLTELEQRIRRLETVVGTSSDNLSRLTAATQQNTIYEAAQQLSAKATMLDSSQLDHIEGRITGLVQKLNSISEHKATNPEDSEKDKMILELYELVKKSENISEILPETIARLVALESLHKEASEFSKSLAQLEALQSQIVGGVQNNKSLLQGVQESFAINLDNINKVVQNLDSRIKAIKK